jgi:hypothetical protein
MQEDDEAFEAFERSIPARSVLDVEQDRIAKGFPPDEALLKHGGEIEDDIRRALEHEAEALRAAKRPAEILTFPPVKKPDGP